MIAFDLRCQSAHVFEAWFGTSADYEDQKARGLLSCPVCGDMHITKAIMAPNVARKGNQPAPQPAAPVDAPASPSPAQKADVPAVLAAKPSETLPQEVAEKLFTAMEQVREVVEKNCDYVGTDFAEEARKIHYGESDERGIYGEATQDEAEDLLDEGIDIAALPYLRKPGQFDA